MSKKNWVKIFEEMDVEKELQLGVNIYQGEITQSTVQESYNAVLQSMYQLKTQIGLLTDSAKLEHLKQLNITAPQLPTFTNEKRHLRVAQTFFQDAVYYSEFIRDYIEHLTQKIEQEKQSNQLKMTTIVSYKPISENLYFSRYIDDTEKMAFYETCLKKVDNSLSLNTKLKELFTMFAIIDKWNGILNERLNNAPSKELAKKLFIDDLLKKIEYDESKDADTVQDDKYWNKYRKIAYEFYLKGQNITLQYFGYLILRNVVDNVNGFEVIQGVTIMFDVEGAILSLAEGAAIAEYLHIESVPVKNKPPIPTKSKLDFAYPKLEAIVLQLASLRGYESPIAYLDELLNDVKQFDNFEFLCNFYLNIHQICKENANSFWSDRHRVAITKWLKKSPIITEIFDATWEDFNEKKEIEIDKTKPTITLPEQNVATIKNNFDNVMMKNVFKHFKNGLVDKKYLSEKELTNFLVFAFEKKEILNPLFRFSNVQTKQKIIRVFYEYYKQVASKPHGKQRQYAALLCNYFEGYDIENVSTNFNK